MKAGKHTREIDEALSRELEALREADILRCLREVESPAGRVARLDGRELLNFSSNDYLGLTNDPGVKAAAVDAVTKFGAGAGASRLISGSMAPHHRLEEALAEFKGTEAALTFSSGYATACGTIPALAGPDDVVVIDKLVHASIVDGARLSGAKLRVFKHNDPNDLAGILRWADARQPSDAAQNGRRPRTLIVTESVFSMDGDIAPLREIVALKEKHGAWLMLDEAHATGLFGARGTGIAEVEGVAGQVDIHMGTLGKAVGSAGGYICGSRTLVDFLINRARSFIFSTAPVPAQAGAALAGLGVIQSPEGDARRQRVWSLVSHLKAALPTSLPCPPAARSAIIPLLVGEASEALALAARLREAGVFVPAIRYPTVARGAARLRATVTAAHTPADVEKLARALAENKTTNSANTRA